MDSAAVAALERACAVVAWKDAQPLRRALFRRKAEATPAVRAALAAWRGLGTGRRARAYVGAYGARSYFGVTPPEAPADVWSIAQYANEARQLHALAALAPGGTRLAHVRLDALSMPHAQPDAGVRRAARELVARHAAGGDFLVAARVASTAGYFLRLLPAIERAAPRAVWVSSDANPYAVALTGAARARGVRTCFVTHGHVAEEPPPLDVDLALLDGPVLRDVYARAGPITGEIAYRGVEGRVRPMSTEGLRAGPATLGVFTSILVDWPTLGRAIARLRAAYAPRRVVLRMHPNREMRDPRWHHHVDREGLVVSDGARAIEEDALACDLVVAGSSSVHLTVLKLGVPSLYVRGLDEVPDDYYGFAAQGIVADARLEALPGRDAIAATFDDPAWPARFARFDAAYPDRQAACDADVARALARLVEGP